MRKIFFILIFFLSFLLFSTASAFAGDFQISLSNLPSYQNTTDFRLYYTYFSTEGEPATVNLFIRKEGKDWRQTVDRDKTQVSDYFQIKESDLSDGEGRYDFYARANFAGGSASTEIVTTNLDRSAPSRPTEYSKERINSTTYKLSWKNPFDEDFARVYLYRSKDTLFTADSSTRIGEMGGAKNEKMVFQDGSVEPDIEYFYALRAIDHAGNASGIVTDAPMTVITGSVAGALVEKVQSIGEKAVSFTQETPPETSPESQGQIEGGISSESAGTEQESQNLAFKYKNWLIAAAAGVVLTASYIFLKKRGK